MTTTKRVLEIAGLAIAAVTIVACGASPEDHAASARDTPAVAASVATVEIGSIPTWTESTATIEPWRRAMPGTKILGRIDRVEVREGDRVAKDALLARLEQRDLEASVGQARAAVAMAEAQLANAEAQHRRIVDLHARGSATDKNLEDARAGYRVAEAAVAQAQANLAAAEVTLGYAEVRSPIAGWIVERHVESGEMATPGAPMFVVEDLSRVKVVVQVPESDVVGLERGAPASVRIDVLRADYEGDVDRIVPAGDPRSRTYRVHVLLDGDGRVRSGMFARVRFPRGRRDAVTVPATAVVTRGQLDGVFVVDGEGRARLRWVRLRPIPGDPARVEVLSGLGAGERFVPAPPPALVDGGRVREA